MDARKAEEHQELHVQGAVNVPPETWAELSASELMKMERNAGTGGLLQPGKLRRRPEVGQETAGGRFYSG